MTLDIFTALDVLRVVAFPLNADGTPVVTEDLCGGGLQDAFEGYEFEGPIGFDVSFGAPRNIPIVAQGQVQDTFILPSIDPKTGVLRCAYDKLSLNALLTGTLVSNVGLGKFMDEDTDKSGQEQLVGLLLQQLMTHDETGATVWRTDVIHKCRLVPSPTGYSAEAMVKEYNMAMSRSRKRLWGESFSISTHGHNEAVKSYGLTTDKFNLVWWMGNGEYTTFNLPADKPAKTSAAAKVWDFTTGAARAGAWDVATDAEVFTPTVLVPDGTVLAVTYEMD